MTGHRLFVDLQTIQNAFHPSDRGIPRYAGEFASALVRLRPETRLALSPFQPWPSTLPPQLAGAPQLVLNTPAEARSAVAAGPHAYVLTSPFELSRPTHAVLPPHVLETGMPLVTVLYDLIPEVLGVYDDLPSVLPLYRARRETIRTFDLVLAISEHTRMDAITRLDLDPELVIVIGAGASEYFHPRPQGSSVPTVRAALPSITKPFVFSVTGYSRHKNTELLIDAWSRLPRRYRDERQLVLTCDVPAAGPAAWIDQARRCGIDDGEIVYTGRVEDPVLRALYQATDLFVLPSLYEGFGLPVAEAVRCGAPAITSNASSLPEVLAHPPATFPPDDADALAALIRRATDDDAFRSELLDAGARAAARHTWGHVAERSVDALRRLPRRRHPQRPPRLRVGLVGPVSSGTAPTGGFDVRLVEALAGHAHVDCFAETVDGPLPEPRNFGVYPVASLAVNFDPAAYDVIVYAIAGRPERTDTYRLACTYPGVVWFHDTRLTELDDTADPHEHDGFALTGALVRVARGCIVPSAVAGAAVAFAAGALVPMPRRWMLSADATDHAVAADRLIAIARELAPEATGPEPVAVPA